MEKEREREREEWTPGGGGGGGGGGGDERASPYTAKCEKKSRFDSTTRMISD